MNSKCQLSLMDIANYMYTVRDLEKDVYEKYEGVLDGDDINNIIESYMIWAKNKHKLHAVNAFCWIVGNLLSVLDMMLLFNVSYYDHGLICISAGDRS